MTTAFRSLRHRNARLFFGGLLVSNIGTWMQLTAMSLLVYRLTGRTTDLGVTVALQFLPMLVLGAWAGAVADRRDKRTMAIVTQAALAIQALTLGALDMTGAINLPIVYVLSFVLGIIKCPTKKRRSSASQPGFPSCSNACDHSNRGMSVSTPTPSPSPLTSPLRWPMRLRAARARLRFP